MKSLLSFLCVYVSLYGVAQCDYREKKIDDMTGDIYMETKHRLLRQVFGGKALHVSGFRNGDYRSLRFLVSTQNVQSLEKGSRIIFKDSSGQTYNLRAGNSAISDAVHMTGVNHTIWRMTVFADNTDEDLYAQIAGKKIVKVRFYFTDSFIDYNIQQKNKQGFIAQALDCIQ